MSKASSVTSNATPGASLNVTPDPLAGDPEDGLKRHLGEGVLYVVATPIGNLQDFSQRAIETLKKVALIAAEDTRHSAHLLTHFSITTRQIAYHDHSDASRLQQILSRLESGESVALVSDAGTPLISDPGYRLVKAARGQGIQVVPVPGACALIAGLSVSGLPSDRWVFEGFLPAKTGARKQRLKELESDSRTLVFYESTHRIKDCIADMQMVLGSERQAVIAREITKTYETVLDGSLGELARQLDDDPNQTRGEFVLMVAGKPAADRNASMTGEVEKTMTVLLEELGTRQAAAIGAKLTGLKKRELYDWCLERKS